MRDRTKQLKRVGIYAGAFNPVHTGHIAFALQAMELTKLDGVIFLPERQPRDKPGIEHFAHRVAMLKAAIRPYPDMAVLEFADRHFTIRRTWPQLRATFPSATFVMLMGSDTVRHLPTWPLAEQLIAQSELAVGVRSGHEAAATAALIRRWKVAPTRLHVFESYAPDVSSTAVRESIRTRRHRKGLLHSVRQYARRNWLYISLENS